MELQAAQEGRFDKSWGFRGDGLRLRHSVASGTVLSFLRRVELGSLPAAGQDSGSAV